MSALTRSERDIATTAFRRAASEGHPAGRWGNLVLEAYDAVEGPARAVVEGGDDARDPMGVVVPRELIDALRAALNV